MYVCWVNEWVYFKWMKTPSLSETPCLHLLNGYNNIFRRPSQNGCEGHGGQWTPGSGLILWKIIQHLWYTQHCCRGWGYICEPRRQNPHLYSIGERWEHSKVCYNGTYTQGRRAMGKRRKGGGCRWPHWKVTLYRHFKVKELAPQTCRWRVWQVKRQMCTCWVPGYWGWGPRAW